MKVSKRRRNELLIHLNSSSTGGLFLIEVLNVVGDLC